MEGGDVSGNIATGSDGGGVHIGSNANFFMSGGTIGGTAANTAPNGGGVFLNNGTFNMEGGDVSGNTATSGGGVFIFSGTFNMEGSAKVKGANTASLGGGVYVNGFNGTGTFTMKDNAEVSGNIATGNTGGGGVCIDTNGIFAMENGTVSGNTATTSGGGVYVRGGGIFRIVKGTVYGNENAITSQSLNNTASSGAALYKENTGTTVYGNLPSIPWTDIPLTVTNARDTTIKVINGVLWFEMVRVPGGSFQMGQEGGGSSQGFNANTIRTVTLTEFYMGKHEITQGQWKTVMGTTLAAQNALSQNKGIFGEGDTYPMYHVSWYDAIEFCNALSVMEGLTPYYTINKDDHRS